MMHVSAGTGVAAIAEARRKGLPVYGETLHQYLTMRPTTTGAPTAVFTLSSLKSQEDQQALWRGTADARSIASPPTSCAAP